MDTLHYIEILETSGDEISKPSDTSEIEVQSYCSLPDCVSCKAFKTMMTHSVKFQKEYMNICIHSNYEYRKVIEYLGKPTVVNTLETACDRLCGDIQMMSGLLCVGIFALGLVTLQLK